MILLHISIVFLIAILLPDAVWAWGAATHLKLAEQVLLHRVMLPGEVGTLLAQFPAYYAYGNIIADLILGKHYRIDYEDHSHNWQVALQLLKRAPNEPLQAAAWGYLSHLAADVVAHEVFIPTKLAAARRTTVRGHAGWEVAFDLPWAKDYANDAISLGKLVKSDVDPFLMDELKQTLFSHRVNKRIFNSQLHVQRFSTYHRITRAAAKRAHDVPDRETRHFYLDRSLRAIWTLFDDSHYETLLRHDPTGYDAITAAITNRKGQSDDIRLYGPDGSLLPVSEVRERFHAPLQWLPEHPLDHVDFSNKMLPELISDAG